MSRSKFYDDDVGDVSFYLNEYLSMIPDNEDKIYNLMFAQDIKPGTSFFRKVII